jgi:hypothetical protein
MEKKKTPQKFLRKKNRRLREEALTLAFALIVIA